MLNPVVRDKMQRDAGKREGRASETTASWVLHVDMDAFFAAVEERDNPSLKGKPVMVGGLKGSRGVVTTCNYVARKYGIHAGMSMFEAEKRCPHGIYLKTYGAKYTWASLELMNILRRFSHKVEPYSIDEAFLDATGCIGLWGTTFDYAMAVKKAIRHRLNLVASVGMGPSKVIAKMASGLQKPDGLTIVPSDGVRRVFGERPVKIIPGVGPASQEALQRIGIETINQLADCPQNILKATFGMQGIALSRIARGEAEDKIIAMEDRPDDKSMGHEHTFRSDVQSRDLLLSELLHLCDKVAGRMRKAHYLGIVVTLKLRRSDFHTRTHQHRLDHYMDDTQEIYRVAARLLDEIWREGDCSIRLIGVSVSGLFAPRPDCGVQEHILYAKEGYRRRRLYHAVDTLRDRFGDRILEFASGMKQVRPGA